MAKKESPRQLDKTAFITLNELLTDLKKEMDKLQQSLDATFSWANLLKNADDILQISSAIRDRLPDGKIKDVSKELCKHAYFIQYYTGKKERDSIEPNFTAMKIDYKGVREEIGRAEEKGVSISSDIEKKIEAIGDSNARDYLQEACICLRYGAYRASVVMSGCALESMVREIYIEVKKQDSFKQGLPFARVIDVLQEDHGLTPDQSALVNTCRTFRNLTGHPSGFKITKVDADALLNLAIEQLRKCNEQ